MRFRSTLLIGIAVLSSGCAALRGPVGGDLSDADPRSGRSVVRGQDPDRAPREFTRYANSIPGPAAPVRQPQAAASEPPPTDEIPDRPLSLRQAIAVALSNSDVVRTLGSGVEVSSATKFDPLVTEAELRGQQARFDPRIKTEYLGGHIDEPPSSFFGPGISTETRRDEGDFSIEVVKPWSLGTTTSAAYNPPLAYLFYPNGVSSGFNPAYSAEMTLELRQPLLRGAGTRVNTSPIHIAQWRVEQSRWDVHEATLAQIRSVEQAYWSLYAAHIERGAVSEVIPLAEESVRIEALRFKAQRNIYADVARAKVTLEELRQRGIRARLSVQQREYNLRNLLGLPPSDGSRLVPVDAPKQTAPQPDIDAIVAMALSRRPDLNRRRAGVQIREWELTAARNQQLAQLDLRAVYRANGLDDSLDHAFEQMSSFDYTDWTLGMTFAVPFGNRQRRAQTEATSLRLARDRALTAQFEQQVAYQINQLLAELQAAWSRFESAMRRKQQTQEWLRLSRVRYEMPRAASGDSALLSALQDFQSAMRAHIDATSDVGDRIAEYNTILARINEAQGASLEAWQIVFADEAAQSDSNLQFGHSLVPYATYRTMSPTFGH